MTGGSAVPDRRSHPCCWRRRCCTQVGGSTAGAGGPEDPSTDQRIARTATRPTARSPEPLHRSSGSGHAHRYPVRSRRRVDDFAVAPHGTVWTRGVSRPRRQPAGRATSGRWNATKPSGAAASGLERSTRPDRSCRRSCRTWHRSLRPADGSRTRRAPPQAAGRDRAYPLGLAAPVRRPSGWCRDSIRRPYGLDAPRHNDSRASLRGCPVNWIS
jgi:hypothetical protein